MSVGCAARAPTVSSSSTMRELYVPARRREIYGIAGVSGNGQAELAEALIGARDALEGEIWIDGAGDVAGPQSEARRTASLAAVPADRYTYALAGALSIADNFAVANIQSGRYGSAALVDHVAMRRAAAAAVAASTSRACGA